MFSCFWGNCESLRKSGSWCRDTWSTVLIGPRFVPQILTCAPQACVVRRTVLNNLIWTLNLPSFFPLSHFGLTLYVGNVPVPLSLLALPLVVQAGLGLLTLLLGLWQPLLAQLTGQRPGKGQAGAVGHISKLFGTAGGCVSFVDIVEAVVVHLIEAVLQGQDWCEAVAPLDLIADV